ncbi:hypothetical protein JTB14_013795 [Gonioctena quinquepunctata]|nr:hypothetical protein JTB14_013795 [Gonioctena quinquepunctata]
MQKPKRKTIYTHCIVRHCRNSSTSSPTKFYIRVPLNQESRIAWINASGRKTTEFSSENTSLYVCEDHFELESDMIDYAKWKLLEGSEVMKKSVLPHINTWSPNNKNGSADLKKNKNKITYKNKVIDQPLVVLNIDSPIKIIQVSSKHHSYNVNVSKSGKLQAEEIPMKLEQEVLDIDGDIKLEQFTEEVECLAREEALESRELESIQKARLPFSNGKTNEENKDSLSTDNIKPVPQKDAKRGIKRKLDSVEIQEKMLSDDSLKLDSEVYVNPKLNAENIQDQNVQEDSEIASNKSHDLDKVDNDIEDSLAARKRRTTFCPLCLRKVAHFARHLTRLHKDNKEVRSILSLEKLSKERLFLLTALRKRGNFLLKTTENISVPVKMSRNPKTKYFVCTYCLGYYSRGFLSRHVRNCEFRPKNDDAAPRINCLAMSQSLMAEVNGKNGNFLKSSLIKHKVFPKMRPDDISEVAKNDPLICLFGESFFSKSKTRNMYTKISNKMREMGRLLVTLRTKQVHLDGLIDALKPDMFPDLVTGVRDMIGYDATGNIKSASLAINMKANLRALCETALKALSEETSPASFGWTKCLQASDLEKIQSGQSRESSLTDDIELFNEYVDKLANDGFMRVVGSTNVNVADYEQLTECLLATTYMLNTEPMKDIQYLRIESYNQEWDSDKQKVDSLTHLICKNLKKVPIGNADSPEGLVFFSKKTQEYMDCLLKLRREMDVVPQENPYLFAKGNSESGCLAGDEVIKRLARSSGAKKPHLLTWSKFREHIANILRIMENDEVKRLVDFVGHNNEETNTELFRLPKNIYQAAKLSKQLFQERTGFTAFQEKTPCESSTNDAENVSEKSSCTAEENSIDSEFSIRSPKSTPILLEKYKDAGIVKCAPVPKIAKASKTGLEKSAHGRVRWSEEEKVLVREYFSNHIREKIPPRKQECTEFLKSHKEHFFNKDWIRVKTFVYNSYRMGNS